MMCVVVTLRFEGTHAWPACPFEDVAFLRNPHRHIFHVKAERPVTHDDRDTEIIMLKRELQAYCDSVKDWGSFSCEQIARELMRRFNLSACEVLEDGENGAVIRK